MSIIIGIDPEGTGAYCVVDKRGETDIVHFYKSESRPLDRAEKFEAVLLETLSPKDSDSNGKLPSVYVFLEKIWVFPKMHAKAQTNLVKSYATWIGLLSVYYVQGLITNIQVFAPRVWKTGLGLIDKSGKSTRDRKIDSFYKMKEIVKEEVGNLQDLKQELTIGTVTNSLGGKEKVDEKQVFDRSEAFLIAYYGVNFYVSEEGINEDS